MKWKKKKIALPAGRWQINPVTRVRQSVKKNGSVAKFVGKPCENGGLAADSGTMSFSL